MKEETTGFFEIILHQNTLACASCSMGITLTNFEGRFRQPPLRNVDWFHWHL